MGRRHRARTPKFTNSLRKRGDHLPQQTLMSESYRSFLQRFFKSTSVQSLNCRKAGIVKTLRRRN